MNPQTAEFLTSSGHLEPRELPDGRLACVMPLVYTAAIITMGAKTYMNGYDERWCFHSIEEAKKALAKWDGTGDPEGWHRHLPSNRRRPNADPMAEYIHA